MTGTLDWSRSQDAVESISDKTHYHAFPYLDGDMGLAMASADMVVCRSGASTLAELPYFGLASILVPYPYAWRYQKVNADYLAEQGAGIRLDDGQMEKELLPTIRHWVDNTVELEAVQANAKALANDKGAENLAHVLIELARS